MQLKNYQQRVLDDLSRYLELLKFETPARAYNRDGGDERIIYAPNCILGRNFLSKYRAEFKRIPSDIMRL